MHYEGITKKKQENNTIYTKYARCRCGRDTRKAKGKYSCNIPRRFYLGIYRVFEAFHIERIKIIYETLLDLALS